MISPRHCPFCGSKYLYCKKHLLGSYSIGCDNDACGCSGPSGNTIEDSIRVWNERIVVREKNKESCPLVDSSGVELIDDIYKILGGE